MPFRFIAVLFLLMLSGVISRAQAPTHLRFYNDSLQQEVLIRSGDAVKFEYTGYLGQHEVLENKILQIGGNAVVLGQTMFGVVIPETQRTILLEDITGFRKFVRSRRALKTVAQLGVAVGSILLFRKAIDRSELSDTGDILLTLGVGIGTTVLVESLFPKKVKKRMSEGWQYEVR